MLLGFYCKGAPEAAKCCNTVLASNIKLLFPWGTGIWKLNFMLILGEMLYCTVAMVGRKKERK